MLDRSRYVPFRSLNYLFLALKHGTPLRRRTLVIGSAEIVGAAAVTTTGIMLAARLGRQEGIQNDDPVEAVEKQGVTFNNDYASTSTWETQPDKKTLVAQSLLKLPTTFYSRGDGDNLVIYRVDVSISTAGKGDPVMFIGQPGARYPSYAIAFYETTMFGTPEDAVAEELDPKNPLRALMNVTRQISFAALARIGLDNSPKEANLPADNFRAWGEALGVILNGQVATLPDGTKVKVQSVDGFENSFLDAINNLPSTSDLSIAMEAITRSQYITDNLLQAHSYSAFLVDLYRHAAIDIDNMLAPLSLPSGTALLAGMASHYVLGKDYFVIEYSHLFNQQTVQALYSLLQTQLFNGKEYPSIQTQLL